MWGWSGGIKIEVIVCIGLQETGLGRMVCALQLSLITTKRLKHPSLVFVE